MSSKTYLPPQASLERDWYLVDATDKRLGRLASEVAMILRGKRKAEYTPHLDHLFSDGHIDSVLVR